MPGPAPGMGRGTYVKSGEESTWGTPVSRTHGHRVVSVGITRDVKREPRGTLDEPGTSGASGAHYTEADEAGGPLVILQQYEGMGLWLKHILGGTPSTTGAGPYEHVFKCAGDPPTGGLTVAVGRGSTSEEVFDGCRVSKATWKVEAGKQMMLEMELIAETSGGLVSLTTPAYNTSAEVLHNNAGVLTFNSATLALLTSFSLSVDNKLARRPVLGSLLTEDPRATGPKEVSGSVTIEYADAAAYAAMLAGTTAPMFITFTSGAKLIKFEMPQCYLRKAPLTVGSVGTIKQTLDFFAEDDGTNGPLIITVTNAQSSAVAA